MEYYNRLAAPGFRRVTIRFNGIEIELRTRAPIPQERTTPEERAYRRARAEEAIRCRRQQAQMFRLLNI
jgi:hypothetical protein